MCDTCHYPEALSLIERVLDSLPEWQTKKRDILTDVGENIERFRHATDGQIEMLERWAAERQVEGMPAAAPGVSSQNGAAGPARFLVIAGYSDLDKRPAAVEAVRAAAIATSGGVAVVEVLTRAMGDRLYDFASGSDRGRRWDAVRAMLAAQHSACLLVETESRGLGRGTTSMAEAFLAADKTVAVLRDGRFCRVASLELTGVDDWKENYTRVVLGTPAPRPALSLDDSDIPF